MKPFHPELAGEMTEKLKPFLPEIAGEMTIKMKPLMKSLLDQESWVKEIICRM